MNGIRIISVVCTLLVACDMQPASVAETAAPVPWNQAFDLDGDGKNDIVQVDFSGGAHCCYRFEVHLTSTGEIHRLPFQLDGGYVGGLDLSQPERFDIRRTDDTLPKLVMEIETYNGESVPLPEEWQQLYGITTHYIAVGFVNGRLQVRDWPRK
jgi:hypothetical protein